MGCKTQSCALHNIFVPDELRGSHTQVLREASGEIPLAYSPGKSYWQHLQGDVIVVIVGVVVDVAIVQVDIGVPRSRRRGRPVIVGLPAGRRIAFSLGVAMLPEGDLSLAVTFQKATARLLVIRHSHPLVLKKRRGERQQHSLV